MAPHYFILNVHITLEQFWKINDIFISPETVISEPSLRENVTPAVFCELAFSEVI